jgi:drug/metabolite transporter (DMT)-like permease
MHWFVLALIGPFLYAITNHIDKILLEKYFKGGGVGTLILFSSLLSIVALPFIFLADPTVLNVDAYNLFILAIIGILNVAVLWCYLTALKGDEASIIIVFYQLMPVIALILAYFILGEVLTKMQLIAMAIILLGTSIIAFEVDSDNKFKLRKQTIYYMTGASFFWALSEVLFKYVALEVTIWRTLFWEHIVLFIIGLLIFSFAPFYRKSFMSALKLNSRPVLGWNFANEVIYMIGNTIVSYAILLAPVSLVLLGDSFQPIFVFAIGIGITLFLPKLVAENIEAKNIMQKVFALIVTGIGTYILFI